MVAGFSFGGTVRVLAGAFAAFTGGALFFGGIAAARFFRVVNWMGAGDGAAGGRK